MNFIELDAPEVIAVNFDHVALIEFVEREKSWAKPHGYRIHFSNPSLECVNIWFDDPDKCIDEFELLSKKLNATYINE